MISRDVEGGTFRPVCFEVCNYFPKRSIIVRNCA